MKKLKIIAVSLISTISLFLFFCYTPQQKQEDFSDLNIDNESFAKAGENYKNYCAGCHGDQLEKFTDRKWLYGNSPNDLFKAIKTGYPDDGMPSYDTTFTDHEINALVAYIYKSVENNNKYDFKENIRPGETIKSEVLDYKLEVVMDNMDSPWGMAFLPNGDMLVTEKSGILYRKSKNKEAIKIAGVPEVSSRGQGGLMDIELHPGFATNRYIYISYSKPKETNGQRLSTTAIIRAKLRNDSLVDQKIIFEALPYFTTNHHYGNRMEFDRNGYLYFSVGERGRHDVNPQSLDNHCGKIHRINDDGSIPPDNPFVNRPGAMPSIYSYGHRNPQGVAMNPETGVIWTHEHGPRGGDEINIPEKAKNYGWPVISYGINYNGTVLTKLTEKEGMEQPLHYWIPSIAPCGMTFVKGNKYKGWEGDLLVGSLRFKYLDRCKIVNNKVVHEEALLKNIGRVRCVEMGNDGYIYVSVENPGIVYRIIPVL